MRTLFVLLLAAVLVAGCNRDKVEENNPPESATVTSDTSMAPTDTSATAPMAATGTTEVTPTDTSSTIVTPTTTTAGETSATETSSTVASTTTR
ncbi:MAG TPA: hypothetical protein VKB93_11825 [Thermoanaerobaculia bacterium]|nr:hypothetical protein [Thermoanaerobaculia bacterium]